VAGTGARRGGGGDCRALNVVGLRRVVITGKPDRVARVGAGVFSCAVQNGSMWAKFGEVECVAAPRRRTAGLVAIGIDRMIVAGYVIKGFLKNRAQIRHCILKLKQHHESCIPRHH